MNTPIDSHVAELAAAVAEQVRRHAFAIHERVDRMFAYLMLLQWVGCIGAVLVISPTTWIGQSAHLHAHLWSAILIGGLICSLPMWFVCRRPGQFCTRIVIACSQMLFATLLIHVTGGRIETHFYLFGLPAVLGPLP